MKAHEVLQSQHDEVRKLFEQCESLGEREFQQLNEFFQRIDRALRYHSVIELEIYYPAIREKAEDLFLAFHESHHMLDVLLEEIELTPAENERFRAKLKVLKELVDHHMQEEEKNFQTFEKILGERNDAIGRQLQERTESLKGRSVEDLKRELVGMH